MGIYITTPLQGCPSLSATHNVCFSKCSRRLACPHLNIVRRDLLLFLSLLCESRLLDSGLQSSRGSGLHTSRECPSEPHLAGNSSSCCCRCLCHARLHAPILQRALGGDTSLRRVEIPRQEGSVSDGPFLVPASCQLICQNYSDLCIRGDQVLPPLLPEHPGPPAGGRHQSRRTFPQPATSSGRWRIPSRSRAPRPGPLRLLPRRTGSNRWRQGSGRDLKLFIHGREGPFTNSLLNCYLEHKLLDLNQQYILENMARDQAGGPYSDPPYPLMASELILTSLDQLTQQLSRERRLEAGLAKDMVISCFLRVASDMSGEISTPMLQFSEDPPVPQAEEALCEEELDRPAQLAQDLG
ncbi:unnamed protein product [Boreogadus saida]